MAITVARIDQKQAKRIIDTEEGHFADVKAIEIKPGKLTQTISALANADGGEVYIGIAEESDASVKRRYWVGFRDVEAANGHLQIFEQLFPLGRDFNYQFLKTDNYSGLVLHIQINKTRNIVAASNKIVYIRRGASNHPVDKPDAIRRLELAKGICSFETELVNVEKSVITKSSSISSFIKSIIPNTEPEEFLTKNLLLVNDKPTVAASLLFADSPQSLLPKRCGVKIYRYKSKENVGTRETLASPPLTVEGHIDDQIRHAVKKTAEITENIPKMGSNSLEYIRYPSETLHEIITNALIHRDYGILDDVHIRIFDNRIEVMSPGRLPGHVTPKNILSERFCRNGVVVRILNKFPNAPNMDVGEGLNTAFDAMRKLGLKPPVISELENAVLVQIKHVSLASPEESIMEYLEQNETINNKKAREITYLPSDWTIRRIFKTMIKSGLIEHVPGTERHMTCYRKTPSAIGSTVGKAKDPSPIVTSATEVPDVTVKHSKGLFDCIPEE